MAKPVARNRRKLLLIAVAWMGLAVPSAIAQVSAVTSATLASDKTAAGVRTLEFEVVSIRPSKLGSAAGITSGISPDGYRAMHQSLWTTIMVAYFPQGFSYWSSDRILGAPPWIESDLYDIVAKVAPTDEVEWRKQGYIPQQQAMLRAMLQAVLAERCKLVLHRTVTEGPISALVVGKHGPKLKEAKPDEPVPSGAFPLSGGGMSVPFSRGIPKRELTFFHVSMASFAAQLSLLSSTSEKRSIQDKTGLTGEYNFVLQRREEDPLPSGPEGISAPDPNPPIPWDIEKLGLTVKPSKAPTTALVIDHIEKPSEN